jgi:hypothetical protein
MLPLGRSGDNPIVAGVDEDLERLPAEVTAGRLEQPDSALAIQRPN